MYRDKSPDPLALLRGKMPERWEAWVGVSGMLYARRRNTSPPVVVSSRNAVGLAAKITAETRRLQKFQNLFSKMLANLQEWSSVPLVSR